MSSSIEKFIKTMGITYEVIPGERKFNWSRGHWYVCVAVYAYRDGNTELELHFCYVKKRSGEISFDEGNMVKEPREGVFSYLGLNQEVYYYFKDMARKVAEDSLNEDDF